MCIRDSSSPHPGQGAWSDSHSVYCFYRWGWWIRPGMLFVWSEVLLFSAPFSYAYSFLCYAGIRLPQVRFGFRGVPLKNLPLPVQIEQCSNSESQLLFLFYASAKFLVCPGPCYIYEKASGLHSNRYVQCARVLMYPDLAAELGKEIALSLIHI